MAAPDYGPFFQASGQIHDIDPLLLQAISMQEDRSGNPNAVGPANKSGERALGVMQFLPSTAKDYGVDPTDPGSAILGAGAYLAKLRKDTNDNLPAMLTQYSGNAPGYATSVINTYHQLQKSWGLNASPADDQGDTSSASPPIASSGDQGGIKITARAAPSTFNPNADVAGHNANFTPPPQTPQDYSVSNQAGSRAAHPMQASEYAAGSNAPPKDFSTQVFGPEPAKQVPPAPPPGPAPAPVTPDFSTQVFGPTGTAGVTPQPDRAPAPDVTIPSASEAPATPQPSWWETNVAAPVRSMYDPTQGGPMNYLLGQPLLQNIGAGIFQGTRNVAQRLNEWEQAADQNYPWLANLDRAAAANPTVQNALSAVNRWMPSPVSVGGTQAQLADTGQRLAAETKAYRTQYGDSLPAAGAEIAGNLLTTYPLAAIGWGLRGLGEALPILRGLTETTNVAGTSAGQNILTTPGQDWRTAGEQGAAGGIAVHGVLGSVAGQFGAAPATQALRDADNLGFDLTTGETRGGFAKKVEDVTEPLPFSGGEAKAAEHRARINQILTRNMGVPESPVLNSDTMDTARANAGRLMDQIQNITVDANRDQQFLGTLANIDSRARLGQVTPINTLVDRIQNIMANYGGTLPGNELHNLLARNGDVDSLIRTGTRAEKIFAQGIRGALQDAASRTADPTLYPGASAANQQAVDAFNAGRYYWKVIKTVEPLVNKTGSADEMTYAGLAQRIRGPVNSPNFDPRLGGDMPALQRVLSGPLAALKSSGTGRQMIVARLLGLAGGEGGLGAATAIFRPENFNTYLSTVVAPTLGAIGGGRILRYGPGMGNPITGAAGELFNPLAPRVFGPAVATNPLLNPPQQGQ